MIRFAIVQKKIVRALIRRELKLNLRELNSKRKFFYPLAEPTYGEREVFSALNSMTSYSTTMWDKVKEFERDFIEYLKNTHKDTLSALKAGKLDDNITDVLEKAAKEISAKYN
jgi:F0F1-type ATP synthase alpha subunit